MVLDDVMCRVTSRERRGLPWTSEKDLEDIDFADDLCLIATTREQLQNKAEELAEEDEKEGLRINYRKTKEMRQNTTDSTPMLIKGNPIEKVTSFCYLGSIVDQSGGTEADIESRINKARAPRP
ncbi:uncharacterized protein LOC125228385 [Leguminivora glycinivorella]|uniref:uncharacterized protein LOC125228385 n=1 Tax=Leguminivora glycinivorella TaxID=1035111 RepID=UPI00200E97E5|nr:uncharacterized protein LOC125228385 [Leguminivora glycinivorella]